VLLVFSVHSSKSESETDFVIITEGKMKSVLLKSPRKSVGFTCKFVKQYKSAIFEIMFSQEDGANGDFNF